MASSVIVTHERHQQNFLSRNPTMKKSQKVSSRPYLYNRLPENPCALEIVGESDGRRQKPLFRGSESFRASFKFDSETASEDSCTLKRKSVNLNPSGQQIDVLGAPLEVFAVSQMSRSEKLELRKRLKVELEQVRSASQKIESKELQLTSSGSVPTISDGHVSRLENGCTGSALGKLVVGLPSEVQAPGLAQRDIGFSRQLSFASQGSQGNFQALGKEKRTPKVNQLYVNSEYVSGNDKMPTSEKQKSKGGLSGVKRGLFGRFESKDSKRQRVESEQGKKIVEQMKQCADILKNLMTHKFGWVFNEPVDPVKLKIPDYYQVITQPMDLGTVKARLGRGEYSSPVEFASDVRLTFSNALKYNPPGNDVHIMAGALNSMFERKWKSVEDKLAGEELYRKLTQGVQLIPTKKQQYNNKMIDAGNKPKATSNMKGASISNSSAEHRPEAELCRRPMNFAEKQKLSKDLEELPAEMPEQIITFLRKHTGLSQNEDEIEVDIDAFDDETLWELQKIVTNCLKDKDKGMTNGQLRQRSADVEPASATFGSQLDVPSPKVALKGGDPGDEYVDVGGNDTLASTFPTVDIEKDMAGASNKCSSSSSSSSDSGSSSSDSDSGSSSGSDSDAEDAHSADAPHKELVDSGTVCGQSGGSDLDADGAKGVVGVLDEENTHLKPAVTDADAQHEGESAPSARQVSPGKLHCAALLRSQFADTILKAQEKTLNQGDRGDPEKLRRDREQLERWQRDGAVGVLDEENTHLKPAVTDADAQHEGENAPSERQASPGKLLRAALLRDRFADTILKAQEKTLNQGDRGDPEKLRHERERLERWKREEKARIQAAAKAAEAARKRAEAEAAAEAKRKREMEREAARLALQNMEKTVDIDENSQILKDLEMMRYAQPDHIPSSGDETSPARSLDGLGNFTLQGGNPLEQLGLFMKLDEEEEETAADCAAGNGDVEEGEID